MKLEIINISREFVADFWVSEKKKVSTGTLRKNVEIFNGAAREAAAPDECVRGYVKLTQIHDHQFGLGHLFDGVA